MTAYVLGALVNLVDGGQDFDQEPTSRSWRSSAGRVEAWGSRRRRGRALDDHQVRLGRLESHGQQRRVLGGVVPATSTLHVGELHQYDAFGLPDALPYLEFPTSHGEATTVLLDGGRNQLAVFRQSGLVMHIDVDDHIGWHGVSFQVPWQGPPPDRAGPTGYTTPRPLSHPYFTAAREHQRNENPHGSHRREPTVALDVPPEGPAHNIPLLDHLIGACQER